MPSNENVRPVRRVDLPALTSIVDEALFPGTLLAGMIEPYFAEADTTDRWLTVIRDGEPVAVAFAVHEPFTEGVWNLRAIATRQDVRSQGVGRTLITHLERALTDAGARILIVDTSGLPAFRRTRQFYRTNGYREEARLRGFWAPGDDKVTFTKGLR